MAISTLHAQSRDLNSTIEVNAGEVARLGSLTIRVSKSALSPFSAVKSNGEPVVVVLEFDAGRKNATIFYKLSADSKKSDLYLGSGEQRQAPRAMIEDFPSWGADNDKEVEILDPKDAAGTTLSFSGRGTITLLFDVPPAQAKTSKKLSITLRAVQPKGEQRSFVVRL